ncbi:hypothetical protein [Clostridium estertheticum]|uniref:hypothetical protein n=1 Tax=Clostridium estertheticum TaxID=238834 RepID=UPI001CF2BBC6|nr:hypothetical protein [Clostridium estertheticum]MCB2359251.1 hypothetical protein [Clostridium estertheticum]
MSNIDEKIAKLRLEQRMQNEREEHEKVAQGTKQDTEESINEITLEDVITQIETGKVTLEGETFNFKRALFLNGKINIPMPVEWFVEQVNTQEGVTLVNESYGVSFTGSYISKGAEKKTFAQFKKGMEKGFKDMELYLEWLEEGECGEGTSKISYGTYKTPTGKGELYNLIFYREKKGSVLVGNYNCFYKDINIWELLIKASIKLMKVN